MNTPSKTVKGHHEKEREITNKCNQCNFATVWANSLKRHLKTHLKEKSYKCNQCNFASVRVDNLRTHLKTHSGEKPHKCNQCDYASTQAGHTGQATFENSLWRKTIQMQPMRLCICLKIHSGEKTHKCNHCEFATVRADSLRTHFKTHSAAK